MINIIRVNDQEELGKKAADFIINKIQKNPKLVLGLATGGTPIKTYRELAKAYHENKVTFKHVKSVNLDEYIGLKKEHPNSYHSFMIENLFRFIDLPADQRFIPNGESLDLNKECRDYELMIQRVGGVDLQLLGIGRNGHIGFNEPGTSFESKTHIVELAPSTQKANARFFQGTEKVPTRAITMGIQSIMTGKEILLLASGKKKAEAVYRLATGHTADEGFPASALYQHAHVTLIADDDALSYVDDHKRRA